RVQGLEPGLLKRSFVVAKDFQHGASCGGLVKDASDLPFQMLTLFKFSSGELTEREGELVELLLKIFFNERAGITLDERIILAPFHILLLRHRERREKPKKTSESE